jgi:hypothetical protein
VKPGDLVTLKENIERLDKSEILLNNDLGIVINSSDRRCKVLIRGTVWGFKSDMLLKLDEYDKGQAHAQDEPN